MSDESIAALHRAPRARGARAAHAGGARQHRRQRSRPTGNGSRLSRATSTARTCSASAARSGPPEVIPTTRRATRRPWSATCSKGDTGARAARRREDSAVFSADNPTSLGRGPHGRPRQPRRFGVTESRRKPKGCCPNDPSSRPSRRHRLPPPRPHGAGLDRAAVVIIGVGSSLAGEYEADYNTPGSESKAASDLTESSASTATPARRSTSSGRTRPAPTARRPSAARRLLRRGRAGRAHRRAHPDPGLARTARSARPRSR